MPRSLTPVVLPGDPSSALQSSTKQYIDAGLALKVNSSLLGATNGVAQLGSGGQVPTSQIPDLSATYATLATAQTISGAKTFSASPTVPATSAPGHAINRGEIDDRGLPYFRASRWGLTAASFHPMHYVGTGLYATSYISMARVYIPAGVSISNICMLLTTVGAGSAGTGPNGFAVYEISGNTATLATNSANDVTLWTGALGFVKKSLNATVASQGTDREVYLAHAVSIATTAPSFALLNMRSSAAANTKLTDGSTLSPMAHYFGAQTSWPASFSITGNLDYYYPFIGVY